MPWVAWARMDRPVVAGGSVTLSPGETAMVVSVAATDTTTDTLTDDDKTPPRGRPYACCPLLT